MIRDARDEQIERLMALVASLEARVAELEAKLRASSRNSSKPPSSDGPGVPKRPRKPPSGKKPGGQAGHERRVRPLVPTAEVDERVVVKPCQCRTCGKTLAGEDASPRRHQVFEIPPVKPIVTEYELHALRCTCGETTTAQLPEGVPTSAFGPSVTARVAVLSGVYRMSARTVAGAFFHLFGLSMSDGAVIDCQQRASEALRVPYEEARAAIAEAKVKHADETGWREANARAWLWVVVTSTLTVFQVHARRNAQAAWALLGAHLGVLVTDRHGAYNGWADVMRQFCWAHLIRDFTAISERGGDSARIGGALLVEAKRMFGWWHRVRDGTLKRATFQVYMRELRRRVEALLGEGSSCLHLKTEKTCRKLLAHADCLWTFVRILGVEPTNNTAERAVRHAVLWRRMSHGTHSAFGSRFVERILTTHASLRQQNRSVLAFLEDACRAKLHRATPPTLLPIQTPAPLHLQAAA